MADLIAGGYAIAASDSNSCESEEVIRYLEDPIGMY